MRTINRFSTLVLALALILACGPSCKEVHQEVLTPIDQVQSYLDTNPSGDELAKSGCASLLQTLALIPDSVEKVREIADARYRVTHRRCISSYPSMHYGGHFGVRHGGRRGRSHYSYNSCAVWQYNTVLDPNYGKVIELSQQIDLMYSQAHQVCGEAMRGNLDAAQSQARDLAFMIRTKIKPESDMIHRRLCGDERKQPHREYGTPHD